MKPYAPEEKVKFQKVKPKIKYKNWEHTEKTIRNSSRGKEGKTIAVIKRHSHKARRRADEVKLIKNTDFDFDFSVDNI